MEVNEIDRKNGRRWLFVGGFLGLMVSLFVMWVDFHLTYTDREERQVARPLRELRGAATSLITGSHDLRTANIEASSQER